MAARPHAPKVRRARPGIADESPRFSASDDVREVVASEIAGEAQAAIARSGYPVGAHLYQRAAALTNDLELREELLLSAADAFVRAGRAADAAHLLETRPLLDANSPECVRVRARLARLRGRVEEAIDLLLSEGRRLGETNPRMASRLLMDAAMVGQTVLDPRTLDAAREAVELGKGQLLPRLVLDAARPLQGDPLVPARAETLERQALDLIATMGAEVTDEIGYGPVPVLVAAGENERALRIVEALVECIRRSGATAFLPEALNTRAMTFLGVADWDAAVNDLAESSRLADELGQRFDAAASLAWLGRVQAARGEEQNCRNAIARARTEFVRLGAVGSHWVGLCNGAIRLLELTLGRLEEVLAHSIGPEDLRYADDWIEAAIRVGRTEDADAMLTAYERSGIRPWAGSVRAGRCRGLLAADDEFEQWFERAREVSPGRPFDRARIDLCLGERRRRAGHRTEARDPLERAADTFALLGARPWAERARRELQATGARIRGTGTLADLTSQERAVARAVATGATNKEAAAQLYLSVKTIEFHLRNAYAKLGLRSRSELARLLADS
jgi:DNA-binding NarL/FixJ family response regulator